jgi:hypothetical protein
LSSSIESPAASNLKEEYSYIDFLGIYHKVGIASTEQLPRSLLSVLLSQVITTV